MKRVSNLLMTLATLLLITVSCQKQENYTPNADGKVTFEVSVPSTATKALGDEVGHIDDLVYAVYRTTAETQEDALANMDQAQLLYAVNQADGETVFANGKTLVTLELLNNQNHIILFWAQVNDTWVKGTDLLNITYPNELQSNNDNYAAFYGSAFIENVTGTARKSVTLTRPFAQVNVATTLPENYGSKVALENSSVTIQNAGESFSVATGVSGNVGLEFDPAPVPEDKNFMVDDEAYHHAAMNYIFANGNVVVTYNIETEAHGTITNTIKEVPVEENYRTNIIGSLLTSDVKYDITIDQRFDGAHKVEDFAKGIYINEKGEYVITEKDGLYSLANLVNTGVATKAEGNTFAGATFILDTDIDLEGAEWEPIGGNGAVFLGNFDGNYKTISNFKVNNRQSAGLFGAARGVIKNLTVQNATIKSNHWGGVIVGYGLCSKVENCTVTNSSVVLAAEQLESGSWDNGDKAGAVVGYLSAQPEAYVKDCTVENVTVQAYRDLGGVVGYADAKAVVSGNNVSSVTLVVDKAHNYKEYKEDEHYDANEVVGEQASGAIVPDDNTSDGVNIVYINGENYSGYYTDVENNLVATTLEGIQAIIDEASVGATEATVINVAGGTYDGVIKVYGGKNLIIQPYKGAEVVLGGIDHQSNGTPSTVQVEGITIDNSIVESGWFTGTAQNIAPCVGAWGGYLKFENCDFIVAGTSGRETGIMTWWTTDRMTLDFDNCTFSGKEDHESARAMQIYGNVDMKVEDCTFTTKKDYTLKYVANNGNKATFNNNTVSNSENFVELGSSVYPGSNYTAEINTTTLGEGVYFFVIANNENQSVFVDGMKYNLKGYFTNENGDAVVNSAEELNAALKDNVPTVNLLADVKIEVAEETNGYGATGVSMTNGKTFDGQGNTLSVPGANTTWASALSTNGGTIKNLTIDEGFRGIFVRGGSKTYLKNVVIDGPTYTISCDSASEHGLEATNSTFNGWTSYAATIGDVKFENCSFGEGAGYAFCRPYAPTEFVGCAFEEGFRIDARAAVTFENCTLNGEAITTDNLETLVTSNAENARVLVIANSYESLVAALTEDKSDIITLKNEISIPEGVSVLDLGGKTIEAPASSAIIVNSGSTLTIQNANINAHEAPIRAIGGKVIIESGTFTQTGTWNSSQSTYRYSVDIRDGGEVIINGGTFNTNNGLISVSSNSSLVIDGGEFTFENNTGGTRHFAYVSGDLTINDGVFRGVADSGAGGCFFCGAASTCNIQVNGGKFTSLWTSGSVNRIFESYASGSSINVTGGLFNTNGGIASFVEANTDAATSADYPYKAK